MATTNFNFTLDPQLLKDFNKSGDYVYFFAFDQGGNAVNLSGPNTLGNAYTLVANGQPQNSGGAYTTAVTQGPTSSAGNVPSNYFIVEQHGATSPLTASAVGQFTAQNAQSSNYTYQMLEGVLHGPGNVNTQYDVADISSVDSFGLNLTLNTRPGGTVGTNVSANSLLTTLNNVAPGSVQSFNNGGSYNYAIAPDKSITYYPPTGWADYIKGVSDNNRLLTKMEIVAPFTGSPYQAGALLDIYGVVKPELAATEIANPYLILKPLFSGIPGTNQDWLKIPLSDLQNNIYAQPGLLTYSTDKGQTWQQYTQTGLNSFTPNNADGIVSRGLVAGFDAGNWGASATDKNASATTLTKDVADLNKTFNWSFYDNYNGQLAKGVAGLGNLSVTNELNPTGGSSTTKTYFDPYAAAIGTNSNSYGYSFSDYLSAGGQNPQITTYDSATGANVSNINVGIFSNSTTPSATTTPANGFVQSPLNYIPPSAANNNQYLGLNTQGPLSNEAQFQFQFSVGSHNYYPDAHWAVTLRLFNGAGFTDLALSANNPWQYYQVQYDASGKPTGLLGTNPLNIPGEFDIKGLPTTSDGSPGWAQLIIGSKENPVAQFNIYETSDPNTHALTQFVVDSPAKQAYSNNEYLVSFAPGGQQYYNPIVFFDPNALFVGGQYQMTANNTTYNKAQFLSQTQLLDSGQTTQLKVAQTFVTAMEAANPGLTNSQFVQDLYLWGLGRAHDQAGLNYWTSLLDSNALTRAQVDVALYNSPEMWGGPINKVGGNISPDIAWAF